MSNRYANLVPANKIKDEYTKLNTGFDLVQTEIDEEIENRGIAEEAIYETVSGMNDERINADNVITARMNTHVNSTTEKHVISGITNDSTVIGATAKVVVESLQGQISSISAAGANAQIGVYAVSTTGTNTLTSTFTGLTYYAGMKMNWTIVNDNTGTVTMNVNSIAAKNVYKVVQGVKTALSPRDLRAGEIAQAQYDGTDFILLNGVRNEEYSATVVSTDTINTLPSTSQGLMDEMLVKGRTYTNLLTDAMAGCESISGWSTSVATVATDTANKLEGTNCLKLTLISAVNGGVYVDFNIDNTKYYLLSANVKNYNATWIRISTFSTAGTPLVNGSVVTGTNYERVGNILQPSNLTGLTQIRVYVNLIGANGQYGFADALALHEISASDYALGVPALLNKYKWHLGTKSVDKMRVLSVGKNLFDYLNPSNWTSYIKYNSANNSITSNAGDIHCPLKIPTKIGKKYRVSVNVLSIVAPGASNWGVQTIPGYYNAPSVVSTDTSGVTGIRTSATWTATQEYYYLFVFGAGAYIKDIIVFDGDSTPIPLYEPCQQTQSTCTLPLRAVPSVTDTWDSIRGKHVKNVSDWLSLLGNNSNWGINADGAGFKNIYTLLNVITPTPVYLTGVYGVDYQGKRTSTSISDTNYIAIDENSVMLKLPDTLTGFLDAWTTSESFTGLSWTGLIKTYMNGWKLTTANLDVTACVWTGVVSGTTQSGTSGAAYVLANADVGYTPYKMIYQLATPITTYLQPSIVQASANGTIYQDTFLEDYGFYNLGLPLTDSTKLITNLVEVRNWNMSNGSYTIIPTSSITITAGIITAIVGAVAGEFYSFDYNYDDSLSLSGELNYKCAINTTGQVAVNSEKIVVLGNKIEELDDFVVKLEGEILNTGYSATVVSSNSANSIPSTAQGLMDEMLVKGAISTPLDQYTKLLMTFEGPDASTTFVDATGKTVAPTGNAQIDTAQFKYGTSSALFDGTGDYLTVTDANNDLDIGNQDFCIEMWVRFSNLTAGASQILTDFRQATDSDVAMVIFKSSGDVFGYQAVNSAAITGTTVPLINVWYHVAVSRTANVTKLFVNGVQEGISYTDNNNFIAVTSVKVGTKWNAISNAMYGWIDDLRISVGSGRYTTSFNPQPLRVLTTERMRILSIGKNLFDKNRVIYGYQLNASGVSVLYPGFNHSDYIKITPSTVYTIQGRTSTTMGFYNLNKVFISSSIVGQTVTAPAGAEYMRFHWTTATDMNLIQLEQGSVATAVTPYQKTQAVCPLPLRAIEGITNDTWDAITGKHTKNVDLSSLGLPSTVWTFNSDAAGFKCVYLPVVFSFQDKVAGYKHTGAKMALTGAVTAADQISTNAVGTSLYLTIADTDTGWFEAWVGATSFTSMAWAGIIKAYFNGWKMTTANVLCASCVWTGIASGTTQSGTAGYAYAQANIDVGYTTYKVYNQLSNPVVTMLPQAVLSAQALGTVYQENFIEDYAFYGSGATQLGLITNLIELRKWNISNGSYEIIPTSSATITAGVITAIAGGATGDLYSFDYNYDEGLGLNGELNYKYSTNTASQIASLRKSFISLDKKINTLNRYFSRLSQGYEDLQISISAGKVGGANFPAFETFTTNTNEYSFAVNDYIDLSAAEPPHNHKLGQTCDFHLHLTTKAANATGANRYAKFTIYVAYASVAGVWTQSTITAELTIPTGTLALTNLFLLLPGFNLGAVGIGGQIKVRLVRIAATGGTEYASSIFATQLGLHYIADTLGSATPTIK